MPFISHSSLPFLCTTQAAFLMNLYRKIAYALLPLSSQVELFHSELFQPFHHYMRQNQNKELRNLKKSIKIAYNTLPFFEVEIKNRQTYVNTFTISIIITVLFCIIPNICSAADTTVMGLDVGFADQLLTNFEETAKTWGPAIEGYTLSLFKWLISIELAWLGIQSTLKQYDIKQKLAEFVILVIYASFMASVIFYSAEWTAALIDSFNSVATKTGAPEASPTAIFLYGIAIIDKLFAEMGLLDSVGIILCCIIIAITFALMTAQVIIVKCESIIVLNAGAILLGFGGSKFTKDYAINYLKYSLAVAAKLFTLQLLMGMSMNFIQTFITLDAKSFSDIILVVCSSVLILTLIRFIPAKVAEIVNVSQVSGGGALTSAMSAIGIATMTAMQMPTQALGGAIEAKRGTDTLREAFNMASSQGTTGFAKAGQALLNVGGAVRDNIGATNMGNLRSSIVANHEALKMQQPVGPSNDFQHP